MRFRKWIPCFLLLMTLWTQSALGELTYPLAGVTIKKANLRQGAGTDTEILYVLSAGAQVTLSGKWDNWYAVTYGDYSGFVREDLVSPVLADALPGPTAEPPLTATPIAAEATPAPTPVPAATDASAPVPTATPVAVAATGRRVLSLGAKGADVSELQQKLKDLGYFKQNVTGNFYAVTKSALQGYQRANGLSADGIAGAKTYAKLFGEGSVGAGQGGNSGGASSGSMGNAPSTGVYPTLYYGSRGANVSRLQEALKGLGLLTGSVDGVYGVKTRNAVRSFQLSCGLSADGVAGVKTHQALFSGQGTAPAPAQTASPAPGTLTPTPAPAFTPVPAQTSDTSSTSYRNLQKGSTGEDVIRLQNALKALGYYGGEAHGAYDDATREAVKAFQSMNGTGVDGVAGSATQRILYERNPISASATPAPKETLAPGVGQMAGPARSEVQLLHWFNDVKPATGNGQILTVYDPVSGLGWSLRIYARGNHCDAEPLTRQDTQILNQAFGNSVTWNPKAIYVKLPDGRWTLATTHNVPHLTGSIKDNDFDGHLCVHFYRDMEEVTKNDPNYGVQNQNALRSAWDRMQ